jgi:hypothetical protein
MEKNSMLSGPDDFDKYISAEMPGQSKYPDLHRLVCTHMMHGPCGALNQKCPCMIDGGCRFSYPRQFSDHTQQGKDAYPIYRRRDNGQQVFMRHHWLDNRWVVPYNPVLLMRYNCHINVKACCTIKSIKYIYKNIYKGHDNTSFSIELGTADGPIEINEVKQYRKARCITAIEAFYRLYRFPLYNMYPPVLQMQVHLPGVHMVPFNDTDSLEEATHALSQRSMLTEYFKMNTEDPKERQYLYREFPEHYIWVKSGKYWKPRKQRFQNGRLVYANRDEGCRYYLRILLNHVRGATSYF